MCKVEYLREYQKVNHTRYEESEGISMMPFAYVYYYYFAKNLQIPYPNEFVRTYFKMFCYKKQNGKWAFKERYDIIFRSANPESPFETLPQYALDRDDFEKIYGNISEALMNESWYETSDFKGWYNDDEWYILHKPSGTLINWYKHCGRTNTCNKVLTIKQHEQFAKMILEDMKDNNIGAE